MMCQNGDMKQALYWEPTIFEWPMNFTIWCFLITDNEWLSCFHVHNSNRVISSFHIGSDSFICVLLGLSADVCTLAHYYVMSVALERGRTTKSWCLSFVLNWWKVKTRQELLVTNGEAAFLQSYLFQSSCHPVSACFWQLCHHVQCHAVD